MKMSMPVPPAPMLRKPALPVSDALGGNNPVTDLDQNDGTAGPPAPGSPPPPAPPVQNTPALVKSPDSFMPPKGSIARKGTLSRIRSRKKLAIAPKMTPPGSILPTE